MGCIAREPADECRQMNIRQLECFRAVLDAGTVTGAAARLGISQPAVSNMVAGLEHELGFALFERVNGRLRPTPEAAALYEDVARTLGSLDRTRQTAQAIRDRTRGSLVIHSYPGIALDFLPRVLSEFLAERPEVRVNLYSRSAQVLHELIPAQGFDIGIVDLPVNRPGVHIEQFTLESVCVLPRAHKLAAHAVLTPSLLSGQPIAALFKEHSLHHRIASAFASANAHFNLVAECRFFASCCALVSYGAAVSIVDPITAADYEARGVVTRRFEPRIAYELGLLLPTERVRPVLVDDFVALLKRHLEPFLDHARAARVQPSPRRARRR